MLPQCRKNIAVKIRHKVVPHFNSYRKQSVDFQSSIDLQFYANLWTGFYMIGTSVMNELNSNSFKLI